MARKFLEDMVQVKRAKNASLGIRPEPIKEEIKKPIETKDTSETKEFKTIKEMRPESSRPPRSGRKYGLWIVAFVAVVFLFYAVSLAFGKAVVTINPKVTNIVLNESLSGSRDSVTGEIPFDLVVLSGDESKTLVATGEKDVATKAEGDVIIYNNFSTKAQNLDIDTRLEGSNGKIYKTFTKSVVPGKTADGKPGSVSVRVYAANAGAEYNSPPIDFKIFGFKGTPKYDKFYGRSKGELVGGFKGKTAVISDADKVSTEAELKSALQLKLLKQATDQIPSGFILFKDAVFLSTDNLSVPTADAENNVSVTEGGTLYGILFDEEKLTKKIVQDNVPKYDDSPVFIPDIMNLNFVLSTDGTSLSNSTQNINFHLAGPIKIVYKFDADALTTELLGKTKKDFNQILAQYPNIDSADLVLSPIWKRSLPTKAKDIKIEINYPK